MKCAFEGIDFANHADRLGRCYIVDDGDLLSAVFSVPTIEIERRAVDCPLGTSMEFEGLLRGEMPADEDDGFQTRATERWLRSTASDYAVTEQWQCRSKADRKVHKRACFFHPTSHIQPTLGLRIVPACLHWLLMDEVGASTEQRLDVLKRARRGDGGIVEAHPRMFLYSAIERVIRSAPNSIAIAELDAIAGYKDAKSVSHRNERELVYRMLQRDSVWTGVQARRFLPPEPPEELIAIDHAFDAWLAALTAWAHENNETIGWREAGLREDQVEVEGHILVLRQRN